MQTIKVNNLIKISVVLLIVFVVGYTAFLSLEKHFFKNNQNDNSERTKSVRIGYFHGGRTMLLYRAYINNEFENEGTAINLITKNLHKSNYYAIPKSFEEIKGIKQFGKVRGTELIQGVIDGNFDGATPGESSFIEAVIKGAPIVAVAMLGHDTKEKPGHAILFRKEITINSSKDIKGKILGSRRAGEGDLMLIKEFLQQEGIDHEKDVKIISQVEDDKLANSIIEKTIDGGYYHLMAVESLVKSGDAYIYRKFDWVNPELSQALLVFHKDFVKKHPEQIKKIIVTYMKRIKYEHSLSKEERLKDPGKGIQKGLQMEKDFEGMNLPQYNELPLVRVDLLEEMQDLLFKHGAIDKKADLSAFIDNRFVEEVYREMGT